MHCVVRAGGCKGLGGTVAEADLRAGESRSWPKPSRGERPGKGRKGCIIRGVC